MRLRDRIIRPGYDPKLPPEELAKYPYQEPCVVTAFRGLAAPLVLTGLCGGEYLPAVRYWDDYGNSVVQLERYPDE